jgi:hypothetical protein
MRLVPCSWVGLLCACSEPAFELPAGPGSSLEVTLSPVTSSEEAAPLLRANVPRAPRAATPWLLAGRVSDYHSRALRRGELSEGLREQAVPIRYWRDASGLWLQPLRLLELGAGYTLALTGSGVLRYFEVAHTSRAPLQRLFPGPDSAASRLAVLCGAEPEGALEHELLLEPGHVALSMTDGVLGRAGEGCITARVEGELLEPAVMPPQIGGSLADPRPFHPLELASPEPAHCGSGQLVGEACLEVLDDRVQVTSPGEGLWLLSHPASNQVVVPPSSPSVLVRGLTPETRVALAGSWFSVAGSDHPFELVVTMARARQHVVINEVLANPRGPEPQAEWIELINDSERATTLEGLWLEDAGGSVPLPAVPMLPGEIVLLVSDGFRATGLDVPVAPSTRVIELESLGARGLTNSGEPLLLVGPEGIISRFPLVSSPDAGRSIARRTPAAFDAAASSFAPHGEPGASPGSANHF